VRWFYDCEFVERRDRVTDLVSIALVAEDGREYSAVCTEHDDRDALPWVRTHVLDRLPSPADPAWRSRERIRTDVEELLLGSGDSPQLWAWYGAYDHVVLCQLWGRMPDLPRRMPRFTRDLRQLWEQLGSPPLPPPPRDAHDALVDARHNVERWQVLQPLARAKGLVV